MVKKMIWLIIAVSVIVIDQITKIIVHHFMELGQEIPLIPKVLSLKYVTNTGAAFSMFSNRTGLLSLFTMIILTAVIVLLVKFKPESPVLLAAAGLIIGGGFGNLIDRVFRREVIDFIDFKAIYFICPAIFNIADTCVVVGSFIACFYFIFLDKKAPVQEISQ